MFHAKGAALGLFSFIGGLIGGNSAAKATDKAADLQYKSAQESIAETRRQFDLTREDFAPYQGLGADAVPHLGDLMGLNGAEGQQAEIDMLKGSPMYAGLMNNGRDAILASASATGGLRGGNTIDAMGQMGIDTLNGLITQQLSNYGGAVGIGSGASGAVGNFGANAVTQMNASRTQGSNALAQAALTKGGIAAQNWNNAGSFLDDAVSGGGGIGKILGSLF